MEAEILSVMYGGTQWCVMNLAGPHRLFMDGKNLSGTQEAINFFSNVGQRSDTHPRFLLYRLNGDKPEPKGWIVRPQGIFNAVLDHNGSIIEGEWVEVVTSDFFKVLILGGHK